MPPHRRPALFTALALTGFAANSLLCRAALGARAIDAWSFTAVRLGSGALTLFVLARLAPATRAAGRARAWPLCAAGSWSSAGALFAYAAAFSLAYLRLDTGVGALTLFGAVQVTMIAGGIVGGERPGPGEWAGIALACAGLVVLTWRGAVAPDGLGLALMASAGVAWGLYSLRGRSSRSPLAATADNFARGVPLALLGWWLGGAATGASARGLALATASGSLASGVGYSLWYAALPQLRATRAAVLQLLVPVLAAAAGVVLLGERVGPRLGISAALILGGVSLATALRGRQRTATRWPRVRQ